jgi:hypothetical protein
MAVALLSICHGSVELVVDPALGPVVFPVGSAPVFVLPRSATFNASLDTAVLSYMMVSIKPAYDPLLEGLSFSTSGLYWRLWSCLSPIDFQEQLSLWTLIAAEISFSTLMKMHSIIRLHRTFSKC